MLESLGWVSRYELVDWRLVGILNVRNSVTKPASNRFIIEFGDRLDGHL